MRGAHNQCESRVRGSPITDPLVAIILANVCIAQRGPEADHPTRQCRSVASQSQDLG